MDVRRCTTDLPPADTLSGLRVLVADDALANRLLVRTILRRAGAEVATAGDGQEAIEMARSQSYDLILMDIQMPELNGHEATRLLRRGGYTDPIVALTADTTASARAASLASGCDGHLAKPFDRVTLVRQVAEWAGRPGPAVRSTDAIDTSRSARQDHVLHSPLEEHPSFAKVLDDFVAGLPRRIDAMEAALADRRADEVRRLAHQLKGTGGNYGYPPLSKAAVALERAAGDGDWLGQRTALDELVSLCGAVLRGHGTPAETDRP